MRERKGHAENGWNFNERRRTKERKKERKKKERIIMNENIDEWMNKEIKPYV